MQPEFDWYNVCSPTERLSDVHFTGKLLTTSCREHRHVETLTRSVGNKEYPPFAPLLRRNNILVLSATS